MTKTARRKDILQTLSMLTEGKNAKVAEKLKRGAAKLLKTHSHWTGDTQVQGLGMANKIEGGQVLEERVLKVYVEKKLPPSEVDNRIPKEFFVKGIDAPIRTDVEAIGKVELDANISHDRPAFPGYSISHANSPAGTFGCLGRRGNNYYILSNSHVVANEGRCSPRDPVYYPALDDGGEAPTDHIAELWNWVTFNFVESGKANTVDAAIARVKKSQVTSLIPNIGLPNGVNEDIQEDMPVRIFGRTSGFSTGMIRDTNVVLKIDYNRPDSQDKGTVLMRRQVMCTPYSKGGDSGSAVCDQRGSVVGLHFAGSDSASFFNQIKYVTRQLKISIVTQDV